MFVSATRNAVLKLAQSGRSPAQIARELGVASATVSYHLSRDKPEGEPRSTERPQTARIASSRTREKVADLLASGLSHTEIARRLEISKATVSYHVGRLGKQIDHRFGRRYDWDAVQAYYDEGHSVRDCARTFGFSTASWCEAVKRGAIVARPSATPISELLVAGTYRGRYNLKVRLLKEGLKSGRCERCGVRSWLGRELTLALHHVNGDRNDNRLENLQLLCPNCHSQTDTFAGRNGRSGHIPP